MAAPVADVRVLSDSSDLEGPLVEDEEVFEDPVIIYICWLNSSTTNSEPLIINLEIEISLQALYFPASSCDYKGGWGYRSHRSSHTQLTITCAIRFP